MRQIILFLDSGEHCGVPTKLLRSFETEFDSENDGGLSKRRNVIELFEYVYATYTYTQDSFVFFLSYEIYIPHYLTCSVFKYCWYILSWPLFTFSERDFISTQTT